MKILCVFWRDPNLYETFPWVEESRLPKSSGNKKTGLFRRINFLVM